MSMVHVVCAQVHATAMPLAPDADIAERCRRRRSSRMSPGYSAQGGLGMVKDISFGMCRTPQVTLSWSCLISHQLLCFRCPLGIKRLLSPAQYVHITLFLEIRRRRCLKLQGALERRHGHIFEWCLPQESSPFVNLSGIHDG